MRTMLAALVMALFWGQVISAEDGLTGDLAALQGRWKAWIGTEQHMVFEVRGQSFKLVHQAGENASSPWTGTLVFDEGTNPKRVTWTRTQVGGRELPDNQCIYELHGDTWLLIGGGAGAAPEHFYSGGGQGSQTLILKREAKK